MTILRSRKILSAPAKKPTGSDINPSTPARLQEPNVHRSPVDIASDLPQGSGPVCEPSKTSRRRSLRLAYKCEGGECLNGLAEKEVSVSVCGKRTLNVDDSLVSDRFLSLRSGKRVAKRGVDSGRSDGLETESRKLDFESGFDVNLSDVWDSRNTVNVDDSKERKSASGSKRKRDCEDLVEENIVSEKLENSEDNEVVTEDIKLDSQSSVMVSEEKGKTVIADSNANGILGDSLLENSAEVLQVESKNKGKGIVEDSYEDNDVQVRCIEGCEKPSSSVGRRKYTWEEKGKGIQADNVSTPITNEIDSVEEMEIENSSNNHKTSESLITAMSAPLDELVVAMLLAVKEEQTQDDDSDEIGNVSRNRHFRDIAKKNASKFAHFDAQMDEEEDLSDKEVEQEAGDWPGPFSTAMKIIRDREDNLDIGTHVSIKERSSTIIWAPKINNSFLPPRAPSLQELSLRVLVKNADAITSLDYIPDALRIKICELLCDSRRINVHFLDLLVRGSPTAICVPDCSWMTEEQFTECFKNCDTSNVTVLQLDQCGNCMPDHILHCTLARAPNNLPMLSSLSLSGAYRLSDVGLQALVSAAPAIRSINLSQCSLLTSSSIEMLSNSLGSLLRELYINECQNIDVKLIQSALTKFEKLEVLSLADLPSVRGQFLREFITARGQTLKQLILTNSVKLTDSFVKVISENCPNLSVLDLANVCKLTDSSLGYLSNGCQTLEKLIFCRNSFRQVSTPICI